jgi:nucleoside-diphosphate-sugar epimerase
MRVLVTGADGFIGRALVQSLHESDMTVVGAVRNLDAQAAVQVPTVAWGDLRATMNWQRGLAHVDALVHLAARAHVTDERARDPLGEFRAVNVQPTLRLFKECQSAGVGRFVFVSSIGVNGVTTGNKPLQFDDIPNPTEPYAISKWEAERGLRELAEFGDTELVIVRPTLVYGPRVKGNFLRLLKLIRAGWPLPFGSLTAERSILSLTALCNLLRLCIDHRDAAGQVLLAADRDPVSTRNLILAVANLMNRRARLVRVAPRILKVLGGIAGLGVEVSRLTGSLIVNSSRTRQLLNWDAGSSSDYDLRRMVDDFVRENNVAT